MLEAWASNLDNYVLTDALTGYIAQTLVAEDKMCEWMASEDEGKGRSGWSLLAHHSMKNDDLPDEYFEPFLPIIERDIHAAKNKTRDAMNNALIAIGIRSAALESQAITAKRVAKRPPPCPISRKPAPASWDNSGSTMYSSTEVCHENQQPLSRHLDLRH